MSTLLCCACIPESKELTPIHTFQGNQTKFGIIVEKDKLHLSDLCDLIEGRTTALRISSFYDPKHIHVIVQSIINSPLYGNYTQSGAENIAYVGMILFDTSDCIEKRKYYNHKAVEWIQQIRAQINPYMSPIDKLRLELDELWPHGASIVCLNNKKLFCGLVRIFKEGSEAKPHMDVFSRDAPNDIESREVEAQLATNVHLSVVDNGRALVI